MTQHAHQKILQKILLKIQYHKLFVFPSSGDSNIGSIYLQSNFFFFIWCEYQYFLGGWVVVFEPSSLEDERVNNGFEYCILVRRPAPCHAYRVIWLFCRAKERCEL